MSIKENKLPVAESVSEENLIRTVSGEGNSQNMTVAKLKGLMEEKYKDGQWIVVDCISPDFFVSPTKKYTLDEAFSGSVNESLYPVYRLPWEMNFNTVAKVASFASNASGEWNFILSEKSTERIIWMNNMETFKLIESQLWIVEEADMVNSNQEAYSDTGTNYSCIMSTINLVNPGRPQPVSVNKMNQIGIYVVSRTV